MKASLAADGGRNDVSDHLTPEERVQRAKAAGTEMVVGLGIAALGALLLLGFNGTVGIIVTCAGFGTTSHGYLTRREMTGVRTS